MSVLDVAGGIWLDRKLTELGEKNKNKNKNNQASNTYVDYATQREQERTRIQENYAWLDETLKTPRMFGYLLKTDKMGFFKALAKAKEMFRSLYAERDYKNMMSDNFGSLEVNPEFVEMIEEIYYKEINKKAKIYDLKLARYNDLRDELIARFEGDMQGCPESYAKNEFGITREEMFEKLRKNELIWAFGTRSKTWNIASLAKHRNYFSEKQLITDFSQAS